MRDLQIRAKSVSTRDGSKLCCLAAFELREGLRSEFVELPICNIALELGIPRLPVVLGEPGPKSGEFLGGEATNLAFNRFNSRHDGV